VYKNNKERESKWVVCIRYAKEVLRTMTMDPSPRERAERAHKSGVDRFTYFMLGSGKWRSDVFKNVPNY
jgi:hypothetical protein